MAASRAKKKPAVKEASTTAGHVAMFGDGSYGAFGEAPPKRPKRPTLRQQMVAQVFCAMVMAPKHKSVFCTSEAAFFVRAAKDAVRLIMGEA